MCHERHRTPLRSPNPVGGLLRPVRPYRVSVVPAARWLSVLAVAVVLVGAPVLVRAWPVAQSDVGASELADAVRASDEVGWSGEVRTQGSVEIPESDSDLDGVARLLGESSTLRVWWRSGTEYRVDRVRPSGETDVVRTGGMTVRWRYEGNRVSFSPYTALRLPDDPDVVPSALARRMLSGLGDDELSRMDDRRVAGRAAAGLRVTPADPRSTIARVDLWVDADSGLPLLVRVYADGESSPVLTSEVTEVDLRRPTVRETSLDIDAGVDFSRGVSLDPDGGGTFGAYEPPDRLGGLERREGQDLGGVGFYGRGPTTLAALPVRDSVARGLRTQLEKIRATVDTGRRQSVSFGPLSVVLDRVRGSSYLLVGTVTPATVAAAADDLRAAGGPR